MTWVISRQLHPDEHYATKAAALLKEASLRLKGVACLVWEDLESQGPYVAPAEVEGDVA